MFSIIIWQCLCCNKKWLIDWLIEYSEMFSLFWTTLYVIYHSYKFCCISWNTHHHFHRHSHDHHVRWTSVTPNMHGMSGICAISGQTPSNIPSCHFLYYARSSWHNSSTFSSEHLWPCTPLWLHSSLCISSPFSPSLPLPLAQHALSWMNLNKLLLNPSKTDFFLLVQNNKVSNFLISQTYLSAMISSQSVPLFTILASSWTCLSLIKSTLYPNLVIITSETSETSVEFIIFFFLQIHLFPAIHYILASHKVTSKSQQTSTHSKLNGTHYITGACKLIDGCSLALCSASFSMKFQFRYESSEVLVLLLHVEC